MGSQTNECGVTRDGTIPRRGRSRSIRSPSIRNGASPPPLVLPLLAQNSSIIGAKPSFSARSRPAARNHRTTQLISGPVGPAFPYRLSLLQIPRDSNPQRACFFADPSAPGTGRGRRISAPRPSSLIEISLLSRPLSAFCQRTADRGPPFRGSGKSEIPEKASCSQDLTGSPREEDWSGQRGSNPRHPAWEADALPAELCPRDRPKYNESARTPQRAASL
jgi:hypothetical protein